MHYNKLFKPDSFILIFLLQSILIFSTAISKSAESGSTEIKTTRSYQSNAFWLGFYLGGGSAFDTDWDNRFSGKTISISASVNFRYHHSGLSCGFQDGILNETHYLDVAYITCGKSVYQSAFGF